MGAKTVLIADRSMSVRAVLRRLFEESSGIEVVADTEDGAEAVRLAVEKSPMAIVLDLDLRSLNGRALVEKLAARAPAPIFVLTPTRNREGTKVAMGLHKLGVVAVIPKPEVPEDWKALGNSLCEAVNQVGPRHDAAMSRLDEPDETPVFSRDLRYVAVGASTGGPGAVYELLSALGRPISFGVAVVQHIADGFEGAFAEWLSGELRIDVAVARSGEHLGAGKVRIAPPGQHLSVDLSGNLRLDRFSAPVGGHRPAADILFRSLLGQPVNQVAAVLLSGMGVDGADAMRDLRRADVLTVVQNEASCAVFGMPRAAIERRAATFALAPSQIGHLLARAGGTKS